MKKQNPALFPGVTEETARQMCGRWLQIIKDNECGVIIFPPKGGAYRRIEQLLGWNLLLQEYFGPQYKKHLLLFSSVLQLSDAMTEQILEHLIHLINPDYIPHGHVTRVDVLNACRNVLKTNKSVSFLLYDTDTWFLQSRNDVLVVLSEIAELDNRIHFVLFCETDITAPELLQTYIDKTTLFQNILTYPLYNEQDMQFFVRACATFFQVKISNDDIQTMVKRIGCHTWLLKEAVRLYRERKHLERSYVSEPTIRIRLETIWRQFTTEQKTVLAHTALNKLNEKEEKSNAYAHLLRIGLIKEEQDHVVSQIPLLAEFIGEKHVDKRIRLTEEHRILIEDHDVTRLFSPFEARVLIYLLQHAGTIVMRESLAKEVWTAAEDAEYSDWALDRLVSRLRTSLEKLEIDAGRLKTLRGRGYIWTET